MKSINEKLLEACEYGRLKTVMRLLDAGVDPGGHLDEDFDIWSAEEPWEPPLFLATWYGHEDIVAMLLERGANPEVRVWSNRLIRSLEPSERGWYPGAMSPAEVASHDGRIDILELLATYEVELSVVNVKNGSCCLLLAMQAEQWDTVKYLIEEAGVDFAKTNSQCNSNYYWKFLGRATPQLFEWGLRVGIFDGLPKKESAEYMAVWYLSQGEIDLAIKHLKPLGGLQAKLHGEEKKSLLHIAVQMGNADYARQLIDAGADVNARSELGTPLFRAVSFDNLDLVKLLVEAGAKINTKVHGLTALQLAKEDGYDAIYEYLFENTGSTRPERSKNR